MQIPETKLSRKHAAEKARQQEIIFLLARLKEINQEKWLTAELEEARKSAINESNEKEKAKKKELYNGMLDDNKRLADEYDSIIRRLTSLKALDKKSRIDPNILIKLGLISTLTLLVTFIELPGNLVNLRAVKIIRPVCDLLKL